jgi:WD40 repeat protein
VSPRLKRELIHPGKSGSTYGLRFSPDGKRIIAAGGPGGVVQVWDVATGKQLTKVETGGDGYQVSSFFVSPDWKTLYRARGKRRVERVERGGKLLLRWHLDGDVRAWDLSTGRLKRTYRHRPPREVLGMELSPDGRRFVTFDWLPGTYESRPKRAVSVWDVATGKSRDLPEGLDFSGVLSPDGRSLAITAAGEDIYTRAVKLFDTATGREKLSIPVRGRNVRVDLACFSRDGRLLVGDERAFARPKERQDWQSRLKWWDTASGREVAAFAGTGETNDAFIGPQFSPDGRTLAALNWRGAKRQLFLFDVPSRRLARTLTLGEKPKGQNLIAAGPAFSPDGKWLAIITRRAPENPAGERLDASDLPQPRIHLIDAASGEVRETLVAPQGIPQALCFSPDGRTLATGSSGKVLLWDLTSPPGTAARAGRR